MNADSVPFSEIKEFVRRQRKLGRYKRTSAQSMETACAVVASVLEPGKDTVNFVAAHLSELIQQYANLNPKVGRATLVAYRSRVDRAINDYLGHRTDPQWQPSSRTRKTSKAEASPRPPEPDHSSMVPAPAKEESSALRHRLPLRPDFDVEIMLPRDFNQKEAKRLIAWISALAGIFEPGDEKA